MIGEKKQITKFLKTLGIDYVGSYKISPGQFLTMYNRFLEKEARIAKSKKTKKTKVNEYLYWV